MKRHTENIIRLLILSALLTTSASLKAYPTHYNMIGKSELTVLWFNIYQAQLWGPTTSNNLSSDRPAIIRPPLLLKLSYQRNISRKKLLSHTQEQLNQHVGSNQLSQWLQQLSGFLPNINKGDELAFHQVNQNLGKFYYQKKFIGEINDNMFAQRFINIWLADDSEYPEQAKQLTGKQP